jgi:hypothetical protein
VTVAVVLDVVAVEERLEEGEEDSTCPLSLVVTRTSSDTGDALEPLGGGGSRPEQPLCSWSQHHVFLSADHPAFQFLKPA